MKKFKRVIASICAVMMIMSTFAATTVAATPKEQEQIEAISEADIAVANALPTPVAKLNMQVLQQLSCMQIDITTKGAN